MSGAQTTPAGLGGFADVLFAEARAMNLNHRRSLLKALIRVIECRRLGMATCAELFGLSEGRVRELLRADPEAFTAEELVRMLEAVGIQV
jgi:predicted XRE-type DNA-binding protein